MYEMDAGDGIAQNRYYISSGFLLVMLVRISMCDENKLIVALVFYIQLDMYWAYLVGNIKVFFMSFASFGI